MNSKAREQRIRRDRRIELRREGLCLNSCGKEAGVNADGSTSLYCSDCRPAKNKRPDKRPPVVVDVEESRGFLDTQEFADYCIEVRDAIAGGAQTIAEIKRAFASDRHDWLADALDDLTGEGSIKQIRFVSPLRWEAQEIPAKKKPLRTSGSVPPPTEKGPDWASRRVTA